MNFCPHCGTPLNGAAICPKCGADISANTPSTTSSRKLSFLKQNIPQDKRKYVAAICIIVVFLAIVFIIAPSKKRVISLTDYVTIDSVSGANGYGHMEYSFDSYAVYAKLSGIDNINDENAEQFFSEEHMTEIEKIFAVLEGVTVTADKADNLSNGDKVTITVSFENPTKEKLDYELRGGSISYTVDGLSDGLPFAPLSDEVISVAFTGASGSGEAIVGLVSEDDIYHAVSYKFSPSTGLSNGDEVTLTASFDRQRLEDLGYAVPYVCERTYIVSGLKEFFRPSDGLSDSERTRFQDLAISSVKENASKSVFTKGLNVLSSEFWSLYYFETKAQGAYFFDATEGFGAHCGIIGMAHFTFDSGNGNTYDSVYFVVFPDCLEGDDGHLTYNENDFIILDGSFSDETVAVSWLSEKYPDLSFSKL